jgi:hypothetical protein
MGGREESGTEMRFQARWNPIDPSAITPDSLYFRGRVLKLEQKESETGFLITGTYTESGFGKSDYIMHADSLQEIGNQPRGFLTSASHFPFELKADEAIISYREKSSVKQRYYKIRGVVEKQGRISSDRTKN